MRVLAVTSMHPTARFPLRGMIIRRHADAIRALGHHVEFCELGSEGGPWRYPRARARVASLMGRLRPDIVHAHFGYSALAVPRLTVPLITSFYGDDLNGTISSSNRVTFKSRVGVVFSQYVAWRSARCITVSRALRARLWGRALRDKTSVVRDAVDPAVFRPLPRDLARARLGLSNDDILVLFPHAADVPTKRVWLAEAAVSRLRDRIPSARLWIVNGKPADEMPWYYGAADLMIVTSLLEGGPSSAKEAVACGIPVVSVDVGDTDLFGEVPEVMIRADASPEGLAERMRGVIAHPPARRNYLPSHLELEVAARAIVQIYEEALRASSANLP